MHFYHPEFLYGLFALLIPLIIHLFNFKRFKKVYFTNISFLRDISLQSKRQSQWRHILIMLLRMAFIAALVFAFAGPYITNDEQDIKRSDEDFVNVFIDNSFSMEARGQEGSLFEEARAIARNIALAHNASDKFRLLTNEPYTFSRNYISREVFLEQLEEVESSKSAIYFSQIIPMLNNDDYKHNTTDELFLISDFQKKQADIENWKNDTSVLVNLVPLIAASQGNVFVDSVWIEVPVLQPKQIITLNFSIQNQSNQLIDDFPISLKLGEKQKSILSVSMDANSRTESSFVFRVDTAGYYGASIEIQDYPVVYDDQFYFSFRVQNAIDILLISSSEANNDVKTYLESDSMFKADYMSEKSIDYSAFSKYPTIVLNGLSKYSSGLLIELQKYVESGRSLVIFPNASSTIEDLNLCYKALSLPTVSSIDTLKRQLKSLDIQSPEFKEIFELIKGRKSLEFNTDLPYFNRSFGFNSKTNPLADILIKDDADNPILLRMPIGKGKVYNFYTPIEHNLSNFTTHAVFVPIMFNLFRQLNMETQLYFYLGQEDELALSYYPKNNTEYLKMRQQQDSMEFIPQSSYRQGQLSLSFQQRPEEVGVYSLLEEDELLSLLSFNYNRNESFLSYFTKNELHKTIEINNLNNIQLIDIQKGTIGEHILQSKEGVQLWKLFIVFALVFLIIELFLLRFSK